MSRHRSGIQHSAGKKKIASNGAKHLKWVYRNGHSRCVECLGKSTRRTHHWFPVFLDIWIPDNAASEDSRFVVFVINPDLLSFQFSSFDEFSIFSVSLYTQTLMHAASPPGHCWCSKKLGQCIAHVNHPFTLKMKCWMPAEPNHDLWKIYFTASTVYVSSLFELILCSWRILFLWEKWQVTTPTSFFTVERDRQVT